MKAGDLVQVLPAKFGHYIIIGRSKMDEDYILVHYPTSTRPRQDDYVGRTVYWELLPLPSANFHYGGPMDEKFIEVVSESR